MTPPRPGAGTRPRATTRSRAGARATPQRLSRHDLYEACVQDPATLAPLLAGVWRFGADAARAAGSSPDDDDARLILGEDFSAAGALARAWLRDAPERQAICADLDTQALARLRRLARRDGSLARLRAIHADVTATKLPPCNLLFVGNFSIGEIHTRAALVDYLRRSRARLRPRGTFVCDTYGGASAFTRGSLQRTHLLPASTADATTTANVRVRYTWEQRHADPLSGRVQNAIHFRVLVGGEVVRELTDAFVYDWRLWSVPELRDAMLEAGFARTEVFAQIPDARDGSGRVYVRPVDDPSELGDSFIVCVAGFVGARASGSTQKGRGPRRPS